ncbi:MAG: autotransporter outer membrane beta-barrel domain-containing protein, partial [Candidatus Omnitrophota bacterium]
VAVTDQLVLGLGGGYAADNVRSKDDSARTKIDSYQGNLYGSYSQGAFYLEGLGSAAYNQYDASRNIRFGTVDRQPTSNYGGQQYSAYAESGVAVQNSGLEWTPLISILYSYLHLNGYTESDAGSLSLKVEEQSYDLLQSGAGIKVSQRRPGANYTLIPEAHFKWLYDCISSAQQATSAFTGGGAAFDTKAVRPARSGYNVGTKLSFLNKKNTTFSFNYDLELRESYYSHSGYANVRYEF